MVDFDRRVLGNTFPVVKNQTANEQFGFRTTPEGSKVKGNFDLNYFFTGGQEEVVRKADVTVGPGTETGVLTFTAQEAGSNGNNTTVTLVDPGANDESLSVSVSGSDITINLATDGSGNLTSTASDVKSAVDGNTDASDLVSVTIDTSGVMDAASQQSLTGGIDSFVAASLERIRLQIRTENRPTSSEQIEIMLPGPASDDIKNNSNYLNVNDYIEAFKNGNLTGGVTDESAQNTAGPQLAAAGFDFEFSGSSAEGAWVVTVPGNTTDNEYTVNAPSDNTNNVLPGGPVLVNVQVTAVDFDGNRYYWGDFDETYDDKRYFVYYTPISADLNDDGQVADIFKVASSDNTADALAYGVDFGIMARQQVIDAVNSLFTSLSSDVTQDVTDSSAISAVEGIVGSDLVIADIPTIAQMNDRGVRLTAPVVETAPGDEAMEGEIRVDSSNIYVYVNGAWKSVGITT